MKRTTFRLLTLMLLLPALPAMAQEPAILDVSNVVVGSQRLETLYAYAMGKWSDAGDHVGLNVISRPYKTQTKQNTVLWFEVVTGECL